MRATFLQGMHLSFQKSTSAVNSLPPPPPPQRTHTHKPTIPQTKVFCLKIKFKKMCKIGVIAKILKQVKEAASSCVLKKRNNIYLIY